MWKSHLTQLIASGKHNTQSALVEALANAGFTVTQSSVSRELSAQGVQKLEGRYVSRRQAGLPPGVPVHEARTSRGGPLVVLHTNPAEAPRLAQAIDRANLPGILGTIAGDDTVFVACIAGTDLSLLASFTGIGHIEGAT